MYFQSERGVLRRLKTFLIRVSINFQNSIFIEINTVKNHNNTIDALCMYRLKS